MFFEFQLKTSSVTDAVTQLVYQRFIASDAGLGVLDAEMGRRLVDHATVRAVTFESSHPDPQTINLPSGTATVSAELPRLTISLYLALAEETELRSSNLAATATTQIIVDVDVTIDHAEVSGSVVSIPVRVTDVSIPLSPETAASIDVSSFRIDPIELDLASILAMLQPATGPAQYRIWNAAARRIGSGDGAAFVVAVQVDRVATSGAVAGTWAGQWAAFHQRTSNRLVGDDQFAVFLPPALFDVAIRQKIVDALASDDTIEMNDHDPPHSQWSPYVRLISFGAPVPPTSCDPAATSRILTTFSVKKKGACLGIDLNANVKLTSTLSIPRTGVLRLQFILDAHVDQGEEALCAIGVSVLTAGAGFVIGGALGQWVGATIGAAIGGLAGGLAILGIAESQGAPAIDSDDIHPVPNTDNQYYTDVSFDIPSSAVFGTLTPTRLVACPDGLTIAGTIDVPQSEVRLLDAFTIERGWDWFPRSPGCPEDPHALPRVARAYARGARAANRTNVPLAVWHMEVTGSQPPGYADVLRVRAWGRSRDALLIQLELDEADARRLQDAAERANITRPTIELRVQTNAGARILTLAGVDATLTQDRYTAVHGEVLLTCEKRRRIIGQLVDHPHRLDELAGVGGALPAVREWVVAASGLAPGQRLVVSKAGKPVASFTAGASGTAYGRLPEHPSASEPLALAIDAHHHAPKGAVMVSALDYERVATLPMAAPPSLRRIGGKVHVVVGKHLYGLEVPTAPRLLRAVAPPQKAQVTQLGELLVMPEGKVLGLYRLVSTKYN
jgi:hypothetical protein